MHLTPIRVQCPGCKRAFKVNIKSSQLDQREAELTRREETLRAREELLQLNESEHEKDVRLIKSCLHPDRHPGQSDRYTRAWQAFERLLASGAKAPEPDQFSDDIPF